MSTVKSPNVCVTVTLVTVIFFGFVCHVLNAVHIQDGGPQGYSRDFLLQYKTYTDTSAHSFHLFPTDILSNDIQSGNAVNNNSESTRRRKRGKRGGVRRRMKRNGIFTPLPSIILANVRSIRPASANNNFSELECNARFMNEFRHACVLCFTETWLCDSVNDECVALEGFGLPLRVDRDREVTDKSQGGGVCMYVNEAWCRMDSVKVRKRVCSPDLELLAVSLRPKYLPREFGQLFLTVVYVPPDANAGRAATEIADTVHDLQTVSPDAPCFVLGDFNSCTLKRNFPSFQQYVTCPTRKNKTIDLCYGNVPSAYKSIALPPIGLSDHNTVHLLPAYRPRIQTHPIVKKRVQCWSPDCTEQLQGCFECTDWCVFFDSSDNIHEATEVISDYILFCENMIVPKKTIKVYPNNKPWVSKTLKATLNEKKVAFSSGDRAQRSTVQVKIRKETTAARNQYKKKVENMFQSGNMRDAWKGIKLMSGTSKYTESRGINEKGKQQDFSEQLNKFYCRFDYKDFGENIGSIVTDLQDGMEREGGDDQCNVEESVVQSVFSRLNARKAMGPDGISGRVLKLCASQLSYVFSCLFTWSLKTCTIPAQWKSSIICPVPKKRNPSSLNDYRPIALTSIVMKCFEKIVLKHLLKYTTEHLDPFQFAYKQNRSTDDATLTLLHNAYTHLENRDSFVRILFIDFSSAFNTIQPHLLASKLIDMNVSNRLILWILDFLLKRTQTVRFQNAISSTLSVSTGCPQGTVLSPVLFTLYTNDCRGTDSTPLVKYSDDTALEDLSNMDSTYFAEVGKFVDWCEENHLDLNVTKTKEMIIDFRKSPVTIPDLLINGDKVERVNEYKYLGTVLDNKLSFHTHADFIHKKCHTRMYCLRKLRSFHVNTALLQSFYRCFIESILTFSFFCWYGGLNVKSKGVLNKIVNVSGKIVGKRQECLGQLYEKRVVRKAREIANDKSHVLAGYYEILPSGRRYRSVRCRTVRNRQSFLPASIELMNHT